MILNLMAEVQRLRAEMLSLQQWNGGTAARSNGGTMRKRDGKPETKGKSNIKKEKKNERN
jgi:hypothetical protein